MQKRRHVKGPATAPASELLAMTLALVAQQPTGPLEPTYIALTRAAGSIIGDLFTSRRMVPADIVLPQRVYYALRDSWLRFPLVVANPLAPVEACEASDAAFLCSARGLLSVLDIRVRVPAAGLHWLELESLLSAADVRGAGSPLAWVTVHIPADAAIRFNVLFMASVRGRDAAEQFDPRSVALVIRGTLTAPMRFASEASVHSASPAVSGACSIFSPMDGNLSLHVFNEDGVHLRDVLFDPLGMSNSVSAVAVSLETDTLLIADSSMLFALGPVDDPAGYHVPRWNTPLRSFSGCYGMAVSPAIGCVFATSLNDSTLHCHRLLDGVRTASVFLPSGNPRYVAVDPCSGNVFISADGIVCIVRYTPSAGGGAPPTLVVAVDVITAAGQASHCRPLCVVPPRVYAAGTTAQTFLVVGEYQAPLLRVLSLPRLDLVCTHRLAGVRLVGLASDPWASALVVCDAESREVRTLQWPMPEVAQAIAAWK